MTLVAQDFGNVQAAFVVEMIGKTRPDSQAPREKFKFKAKNRNMPMRPWSFGTEVKTARFDYPGAVNSPTEQVLSVRMTDFTLNGRFSDKWNYPGYAIDAWRALERVTNYGQMVRCSYRSVYVDGIITRNNFDYHREEEIFYSITVSPHNREPGQKLKSSPRTVLNAKQLLSEVTDVRDQLSLAHSSAPRFFVSGTLWDDVDEIISEWNATIDALNSIISQRIVLPDVEPGLALKRIADAFRLVRSNAESMVDLLSAKRSDTDLTYAGGLQILRFDVWTKSILKGCQLLILAAENASREMLSRANPNMVAIYRPRQGEHLMKISNMFYGDPGNWRRIATRNSLGSALILTGQELLIIPEAVTRR